MSSFVQVSRWSVKFLWLLKVKTNLVKQMLYTIRFCWLIATKFFIILRPFSVGFFGVPCVPCVFIFVQLVTVERLLGKTWVSYIIYQRVSRLSMMGWCGCAIYAILKQKLYNFITNTLKAPLWVPLWSAILSQCPKATWKTANFDSVR